MSEFAIQIPPDSTGKSIRHEVQIEIDYTNKTGTFPVGEVVTFATSQVIGTILLDHTGIQHPENHLHIKLKHGSPTDITEGENMQVDGVTIHSVRLPGLAAHQEVLLGGAGQTLSIRHDTINRECYVPGVIIAIKKVVKQQGLIYGLDTLLGLSEG